MLLFALSITLLGALTLARRLVEPACPACSAKNWMDEPAHLQCGTCGWTTVPAAITLPTEAPASAA